MAVEGSAETHTQAAQSSQAPGAMGGARNYLSLSPLKLSDLPPHRDLVHDAKHSITVSSFIERIVAEATQFDLDNGWTSHGKWQPHDNQGAIDMPPKASEGNNSLRKMTVSVEQRVRGKGKNIWLGRRSYHSALDIDYMELDNLLSQDHARQEAEYTPSVFDANELITWDAQDLKNAVTELDASRKIETVQMALYQMFHTMPSAMGGLIKLQDRVFHVLVITVHLIYSPADDVVSSAHPQSLTVQLPVDIHSLRQIPTILERSHTDAQVKRYNHKPGTTGQAASNSEQQSHNGNRLTEGSYVSLERVRKAPREDASASNSTSSSHQWDMMTMSDAKGITSIASKKQIMEGTLDAVTKDVYYVLGRIREQRQDKQDQQGGGEVKKQQGKKDDEIRFTRVQS